MSRVNLKKFGFFAKKFVKERRIATPVCHRLEMTGEGFCAVQRPGLQSLRHGLRRATSLYTREAKKEPAGVPQARFL